MGSYSKDIVEVVKERVTIADYFDKVIVPQMADYYSDYTVNFELKPVVKCPIHGEDTPSLRYYEETNTFYCFGCRAGGDVINLHRLYTNAVNGTMPEFDEAVMYLYKYFVQGRETTANKAKNESKLFGVQTLGKNGPVIVNNSNTDKLIYNKFIRSLEDTLMIDKSIYQAKRERIYNLMDNTELLISLDILRVNDAIQEIKKAMRE